MKAVMLSLRPQWCEKIFNGEKTIEVRRNRPKIEPPFEGLVYETKGKTKYWSQPLPIPYTEGSGKVIGSFICDRIIEMKYNFCDHPEIGYPQGYDCGDNWWEWNDEDDKTCLTDKELTTYARGLRTLYGWHITEPKLFDKPRELCEFYAPCRKGKETADESCKGCPYAFKGAVTGEIICDNAIIRPPQSFCYVDVDEQQNPLRS